MNRFYKGIISVGLAAYLSVCSGCVGINKDGSLYVDNKEISQENENWRKAKKEINEDIDERNKEGMVNLRKFGNGFDRQIFYSAKSFEERFGSV